MTLIDRDALLELAVNAYNYEPTAVVILKRYIEDAPTIEATPVKCGKWQEGSDEDSSGGVCSACNRWSDRQFDYCPKCGTKMDVEE